MAGYHTFTANRSTEPDLTSLLTQLRSFDVTCGVQHQIGTNVYTIKKATDWTAPQVTAAQSLVDAAPAASAQLTAQAIIDGWPIEFKALILALIDQLNVIRAALPSPLPAVTPAQALAAIRAKAASL